MLEKDSNIDTDDDELFDWDEVDVEAVYDIVGGNVNGKTYLTMYDMPTLNQCVEYVLKENSFTQKLSELFKGGLFERWSSYLGNIRITPIYSSPTNEDSDNDGLFDDEEYYSDTKRLCSDTDKDGLTDLLEVELWFDPLNSNVDGDSYTDYEEWENGTSPYSYDLTFSESISAFWEGFTLGDWSESSDVETLLGQMSCAFVPIVGDFRDYFADILKEKDTMLALGSLWGCIGDVVSVAGIGSDMAKSLSKLGRYIVKYSDDVPLIGKAILKGADLFKNSDQFFPALVKMIPAKTLEKLRESVKNTKNLTEADYSAFQKLFKAAGENTDEIIQGTKFGSFRALKKYLGDPGEKCEWHHLVEQCQSNPWRSKFSKYDINCPTNVVSTPKEVHEKISAYYSTKQQKLGNKTVRDWLNGQSYEEQLKFGLETWEKYMKEFGYNIDEWVN